MLGKMTKKFEQGRGVGNKMFLDKRVALNWFCLGIFHSFVPAFQIVFFLSFVLELTDYLKISTPPFSVT